MKRPSSGRKSLDGALKKVVAATILDCHSRGAFDQFSQMVGLLLFFAAHRHVVPNMLSLVVNPTRRHRGTANELVQLDRAYGYRSRR